MGHTRVGQLPRTRAWRQVVELIAVGADVAQVSQATIKAAESAFSWVNNDGGYNHAVWLMAQLGIAAGQPNPAEYLRRQGVNISDQTSLPGIAAALTTALDNHVEANGGHSDLGALAQRALVDSVLNRLEPKLQQQSLFRLPADEMCSALAEFRKPGEFGMLARAFYSRLTNECMNYFLSQTLATHLGEGMRFATTNQMAQFEDALSTHCREASAIVEQFSANWFSLHRYTEQGEISPKSVRGFASYALKKMKDELKAGAMANGH